MRALVRRRPKVRDILAELRAAGWVPVRCRGSHQQWHSPQGRTITVVVNHKNDDATPAVIASLKRMIKSAREP